MCCSIKSSLPLAVLSLVFLLVSCSDNPESYAKSLNGYWEIQEVTLPNGEKRGYEINTLIDYFEVEDTIGFRKKVAPQPDGTFQVSSDVEEVRLQMQNDSLHLHYSTPFDNRKETVLEANDDNLVLLNPDGKKYTYKRYKKITLD